MMTQLFPLLQMVSVLCAAGCLGFYAPPLVVSDWIFLHLHCCLSAPPPATAAAACNDSDADDYNDDEDAADSFVDGHAAAGDVSTGSEDNDDDGDHKHRKPRSAGHPIPVAQLPASSQHKKKKIFLVGKYTKHHVCLDR